MPSQFFSDSETATTPGSSAITSGFTTPRPGSPRQLIPLGGGATLTSDLMSHSVPQTIRSPQTQTKETITAHFAKIRDVALFYDLQLPYFCQFLMNCCDGPGDWDLRIAARTCIGDMQILGKIHWDVFETMVEQVSACFESTASVLLWRMEQVLQITRSQSDGDCTGAYKKYIPTDRDDYWSLSKWFRRLLLLLEEEVKKQVPESNVILDELYDIITGFYEIKFREFHRFKPDMRNHIPYPSTDLTPIVRFQHLRATLLAKYDTIDSMLVKGKTAS